MRDSQTDCKSRRQNQQATGAETETHASESLKGGVSDTDRDRGRVGGTERDKGRDRRFFSPLSLSLDCVRVNFGRQTDYVGCSGYGDPAHQLY